MSYLWYCIAVAALLKLSYMNFMILLYSDGTAISNWPIMLCMCEYSDCSYVFPCILLNMNFFISISVIHYYKGDWFLCKWQFNFYNTKILLSWRWT